MLSQKLGVEHIFRAYDIRGIFNKDLDTTIMNLIGRAYGTLVANKGGNKITVGGDIRASTHILLESLLSGIASTGISVEYVEPSPLGVTLFHAWKQDHIASAFITASHLPPEWNGVKFYHGKGMGFSPDENNEVKSIFDSESFNNPDAFNVGTIEKTDPYDNYVAYLAKKFSELSNTSIAIDCGNGAMSLVANRVFQVIGLNTKVLFCEPDPKFPNRPSEPGPEVLGELSKLVTTSQYPLGVAFDGDGDRAVIVDDEGHVLSGDETGIIIAKYLLEKHPNSSIVINVETSLIVEQELKKAGANVKWIPVGHSYLSFEAEKENAIFGIEASGHMIAPKVFLFDDAIVIPLLMIEALDHFGTKLSILRKQIPSIYKERFDLPASDQTKFAIIEKLRDKFEKEFGQVVSLDGVMVSTEANRVLIRASNTSPLIRVTIEANSSEEFERAKTKYLPLVEQIIKNN